MKEFDVIILEDETGGKIGHVTSLPVCYTQGDNIEELLNIMKEAISLHIETLEQEEKDDLLQHRVIGIQKVKALA
jgi:predicted RNase H-like HicB family nuclease